MGKIVIQSGAPRKNSITRKRLWPRLGLGWLGYLGWLGCLMIAGSVSCWGQASLLYGADPGEAKASIRGTQIVLENDMFALRWSTADGVIAGSELVIRSTEKTIPLSRDIFVLKLKDGSVLRSSTMRIRDAPRVEELSVDRGASRSAQHFPGEVLIVRFEDRMERLSVTWRAILRSGSNYVRQELSFHAIDRDAPIYEVELFDFKAHGARVVGTVKGSPVTVVDTFFGFEHPLSACEAKDEEARCSIARALPLRAGQTVTYSSVIGVCPAGQMRRGS